MKLWKYEWTLLLRSKVAVAGLAFLAALTVARLISGVQRMMWCSWFP